MNTFGTVSSLNLITLVIVLLAVVAYFFWFRRKPQNRNPMGDKGMEANHPVQKPEDRL